MLGSFCPCLIGLYEQVAAAELVSLGPTALNFREIRPTVGDLTA